MSDVPPPPPPSPEPENPALPTGGIYIRWRNQLWQEQPDGSYLLWDETTRQWIPSTVQPPSETGQTVATRECPNCGRRVKTTLRSCPYCQHGFEAPPARERADAAVPQPGRAKPLHRRRISGATPLIALVIIAAIALGVFLKVRSDSCENWKAGVRSYTQIVAQAEGVPSGMSEQEFGELNEDRFADTRPGGCE